MKVVLRKDVVKLGEIDDVLEVSEGYGRNYLLPQKLAVIATPKIMVAVAARQEKNEQRRAEKIASFEAVARQLADVILNISADVGEEGRLFGSVTANDISAKIKETTQLEIDKKKIELAEPIKQIGEYTVLVKLYRDITVQIKVNVVAK